MKINPHFFPLSILNNKTNLINLKPGDIIEGKVIDIAGNEIVLRGNNGELLKTLSTDKVTKEAIRSLISKVVKFSITNIEEDKIFIVLKSNNETKNEEFLPSSSMTKSTFIGSNKEDSNILMDAMLKNHMPLTEDNIKLIYNIKKCYNKLSNYFDEIHTDDNLRKMNVDVLVKKLLLDKSNKLTQNKSTSGLNEHQNPIELIRNQSTTHEILNEFQILKNVTYYQLAFMYKNKIEFTFDNLILLNNLFLGKKTITDQIISILDNKYFIDSKPQRLISIIKSLISDNRNRDELKSVYDILIDEMEKFKSYAVKNKFFSNYFEEKTNDLKASIDFIKNLNQSIIFIQTPIFINNELFNFEIFTNRKNKSRKFDENYKILISLDTRRLERISVLIDINKVNITLNFKVKSDFVKNLIIKNEPILSERIKKIGFNRINFNYKVDVSPTDNLDLWHALQATTEKSKIDLRV